MRKNRVPVRIEVDLAHRVDELVEFLDEEGRDSGHRVKSRAQAVTSLLSKAVTAAERRKRRKK